MTLRSVSLFYEIKKGDEKRKQRENKKWCKKSRLWNDSTKEKKLQKNDYINDNIDNFKIIPAKWSKWYTEMKKYAIKKLWH